MSLEANVHDAIRELEHAFTVRPIEPDEEVDGDERNRCGATFTSRDDSDPDPPVFCDECAQEMVQEIPRLLAYVRTLEPSPSPSGDSRE